MDSKASNKPFYAIAPRIVGTYTKDIQRARKGIIKGNKTKQGKVMALGKGMTKQKRQ
jgi:hypothetical protein